MFTSLTKEAMPVVRYRTRDLTRLEPGTAYPAFRRMRKVTGRTDDMMIVRGVNVFPSQVEEQLLTVDGLAPHYLCVLERPGNLDELTVRVEARPGTTDREPLGRLLAERIKNRIGVTARVEVVDPGALERSLGKATRISDRARSQTRRGRVRRGRPRPGRTPGRRGRLVLRVLLDAIGHVGRVEPSSPSPRPRCPGSSTLERQCRARTVVRHLSTVRRGGPRRSAGTAMLARAPGLELAPECVRTDG